MKSINSGGKQGLINPINLLFSYYLNFGFVLDETRFEYRLEVID